MSLGPSGFLFASFGRDSTQMSDTFSLDGNLLFSCFFFSSVALGPLITLNLLINNFVALTVLPNRVFLSMKNAVYSSLRAFGLLIFLVSSIVQVFDLLKKNLTQNFMFKEKIFNFFLFDNQLKPLSQFCSDFSFQFCFVKISCRTLSPFFKFASQKLKRDQNRDFVCFFSVLFGLSNFCCYFFL